ncbi:uncharacterized protein PRCAT00002490001 [Priceomyces carsonii]|uniref:uncharacterized protein n=1 Tax=Priceomyces carsonii TaxID=28549 RepID=UPI002EDAA9D0|nr:unnamed protein product [Priceomyces carsonii]
MSSLKKIFPHIRQPENKSGLKDLDLDSVSDLESSKDLVEFKEYRDEANRPWWKFFDEYEYRLTKSEASRYEPWRWFPKGISSAEKKLLLKLDILVAFYSFVGYWVKYLDSANLNNAYVSGLKEDIGMKGNDLIETQTIFLVGNIIFELPWLFLLPRIPIPYVLFSCETIWALFTLFTFKVKNPASLKAFRFIIGSAEACYFPIFHYTLASWYKPDEVGRRGGLFYCGQFLGILTSGLLQSAASQISSSNLKGWQWMFFIDGFISLGVAIMGLLMHPGTPTKCYSLWLTDDEIILARERLKSNNSDASFKTNSFFDKKTWKNIVTSWHFWLFGIAQIFGFNTNSASYGSHAIWLKSLNKYSVSKLNQLTAIPPALGILWVIIVCFGADLTGKRFGFIIFSFLMNFVSNLILAIWDVSESAKWVGFCMSYWSWSQSSVFNPLISDILRHDNNQRAIEWMIVYLCGLTSLAIIGRYIFQTTDSPRYLTGFTTCAVFSIAFIITVLISYIFYKRDEKNNAKKYGIYIYNSEKGDISQEGLNNAESPDSVSKIIDFSHGDEFELKKRTDDARIVVSGSQEDF